MAWSLQLNFMEVVHELSSDKVIFFSGIHAHNMLFLSHTVHVLPSRNQTFSMF